MKITRRDFIKAAVMGLVGAVGAMFLPKLNQESEIVKMAEDAARLIPPGKDLFAELIQGIKRETYHLSLYYPPDAASDGIGIRIQLEEGAEPFVLQCHTLDDDVDRPWEAGVWRVVSDES